MRNRAKCKLCESIIESFHRYDWTDCKCGEISVTGGPEGMQCAAANWDNFLRVDDQDKVIIPRVVSISGTKNQIEETIDVILPSNEISYGEKLSMLKDMVKNLDELPQDIMMQPINHYDFYSFVVVMISLLEQVALKPSSQQPSQDQQVPSD